MIGAHNRLRASAGRSILRAMSSVRVVVLGRVQGVGYRAFAARSARTLALTGEVRNLSDDTVEVVAHGAAAALDEYLVALRVGPVMARVEDATVQWFEQSEIPRDFRITG